MKRNYATPEIEIFLFEKKDIVTASAAVEPETFSTEHENGYNSFRNLL